MKNTIQQFSSQGFSLMELMVVMAILGILASIAIPAYNDYINTAKMVEADNNLAALRLAEEEYFLENNDYFGGVDTNTLALNSLGLWSASKGSNGNVNFTYVASNTTTTWSATATGYGQTRSASK